VEDDDKLKYLKIDEHMTLEPYAGTDNFRTISTYYKDHKYMKNFKYKGQASFFGAGLIDINDKVHLRVFKDDKVHST